SMILPHETFAKRSLLPISVSPMSGICQQAQIVILKILNVWMPVPISSGWLIRLRRIAFLELEPRLNIKTDLTGQAKLSIFQRSHCINFSF
ncbi:MAG: hypothetical protein V3T59_05230, partial [Desulfobacterales bacterium]